MVGDPNANIISISATANTATAAALTANDVTTALVRWRAAQRSRQQKARVSFLQQQLATLAGKTDPSDVAAASDLRTQLAQALADLRVPSPELTVVSAAHPPGAPFTPRPLRDGIIGLLAGLVIGVFAGAIRDRLDRRLHTLEEVEAHYPYPVLGVVPHVAGDARNQALDLDPRSPLADAYRTIRTNLALVTLPDGPRLQRRDVWVISSAVPAEGKSAAVANLSRALATSGLSVLAISADLHKPVLHQYFGAPARSVGLADVLVGDYSLDMAVRIVYRPDGAVSSRGRVSLLGNEATFVDPAVLYQSPAMGRLIERARELFDVVLIDTSPVLVTSEAPLLSRLADGLIMVARLGHLTRHQAARAARALTTVGVAPVGLLVTGYRDTEGYYGYGAPTGSVEETIMPQQRPAVRGVS